MSTHDDVRVLVGALVLGGLSEDDRATVTQHLRTCADCRAELTDVAPLPGLLNRMPAEARDDPARRAAEPADGQLAVLPGRSAPRARGWPEAGPVAGGRDDRRGVGPRGGGGTAPHRHPTERADPRSPVGHRPTVGHYGAPG